MTEEKVAIDEAIGAVRLIVKYPGTPIGLHTIKALKLGIEALKKIKEQRSYEGWVGEPPLPGETE